jgi:PQQ-like domain
LGRAFNNPDEESIVYGHGLGSSSISNAFFSLSNGGTLVSRDVKTDKELFRVKVPRGSHVCDCLSLSPDSRTIGISLRGTKNVLFFDSERGELVNDIINTHSSTSHSATWLDNDSFCVGYKDGTIKKFSLSSGKCILTLKAAEVGVLSVLEANDSSSLFAMDNFNSVYLFDMNEGSVKWKVYNWHEGADSNQWKYGLKRSFDGKKLATSGDSDNLVRAMDISNQKLLWETSIFTRSWGISWVPGDTYLLVIGETAPFKVAALSGQNGSLIFEIQTGFDNYLYSLSVHFESKTVLVGDHTGKIIKLAIED